MPFLKSSASQGTKNRMWFSRLQFLGIMAFSVFSGGCAVVGPDFVQPDVPTLSGEYRAKEIQHQPAIELDQWWQSFADPILDQLVSRALANNLTVQITAERIIEARANVSLNGGNLAPNVNYVSSYEYLKRSPNARQFSGVSANPFQLFTPGLDSTWEIDLFGRLERSIQAAEHELLATEFSLQSVQQTLVADVATSYLNIRLLQNQIQIVDQSLLLQQETNQVVSGRAEAGVSTKLDSEQTIAFLHRSEAEKAGLELLLNCEFNRLSILLGESPTAEIRDFVGYGQIPEAPYIPEAGVPANLIRRRPDVRQAEANIAAATARIGIAEADLYPTLSLFGNISLSSQNVSNLFETGSLAFSVGPSFTWNILHFGRINDNIEIHESQMRQTVGSYRAAVLEAVKEVEDAMVKYDGHRKQLLSLDSAMQADTKAVELSLQRYKVGKSNFQRVLDSQLQLLQDSQASSAARANANIQLIRLYRALGGGWPGQVSADGGGCAQCVADQDTADCGCWADNTASFQDVGYGSDVQSQTGIPGHATVISGDENVAPAQPYQDIFGSNLPQTLYHDSTIVEGGTVLQLEEVPSQVTGSLVRKSVANELFNWSEQDIAVARSKYQNSSSGPRVAKASYVGDAAKGSSKQIPHEPSSTIRPDAVEWVSEAMKGN